MAAILLGPTPARAAEIDVTFGNYNIYATCGADHDALSIGADDTDYPGVDVSDWEYSLDSGGTWLPYTPVQYATPAGSHPKFGGESHYILTLGASEVRFRALDVDGDDYRGSIALAPDAPECSQDPDYTPLLPLVGGAVTDGPGLANDSFVVPSSVVPATAFYNESIAVQRADGSWVLWTPDVPMTLGSLGYLDDGSIAPGATLTIPLARSGGAGERADLQGAQYQNQATNTPGIDYLSEIRFGQAHLVFTNDVPVGQDDTATTTVGRAIPIDVLGNDPSRAELVLGSVTVPGDGSATIEGGVVRYTPRPGFSGVDTFTYTACDADELCVTQTVTVTVVPSGDDDTASTPAGTPVRIDVLANDPAGPSLTVTTTTDGARGTVTINPDGTLSYVPEPGFSGEDTFTYTACDADGQCVTQTVRVTVTAETTPPQPEAPATPERNSGSPSTPGPKQPVASGSSASAAGSVLARTGSELASPALAGIVLVAAGAALALRSRRRRSGI